MGNYKLDFEDIAKCKDIADFNDFVKCYLDERNLEGEERRKIYWALFYKWKESSKNIARE